MPSGDVSALYAQVRRRLIESGEWDLIRAAMSVKLNESGWSDEVHHSSKESARNTDQLFFHALLAETAPRAQTSIPLAVKREISSLIKQHLDKQFE